MRKIRLSESQLTKIVERVIREFDDIEPVYNPEKAKQDKFDVYAKHPETGLHDWRDKLDRPVKGEIEFDETKTFGPGEYEDFMEFINDCQTAWCTKTKKWYDVYAKQGKIHVGRKAR